MTGTAEAVLFPKPRRPYLDEFPRDTRRRVWYFLDFESQNLKAQGCIRWQEWVLITSHTSLPGTRPRESRAAMVR